MGAAGGVEEDVGGFDVAVDHAGGVGGAERVGDVAGDRENRGFREGLAVIQQIGQRERPGRGEAAAGGLESASPLRAGVEAGRVGAAPDFVAEAQDVGVAQEERFRDEERDAGGGIDAGAQDRENRRVVESGESGCLAFESEEPRGALRRLHRLQRDVSAGRVFAGEPHHAHAALAERAQEREIAGKAHAGAERGMALAGGRESASPLRAGGQESASPLRAGGRESASPLVHRPSSSAASNASRRSSAERRPWPKRSISARTARKIRLRIW